MIRNYRKRHYTIILTAIFMAVSMLIPLNAPEWVEKGIFFIYVFGLAFLGIGDKTEKPDELTRLDLSKANTVTMWCSLICIFAYSLFSFNDSDIVRINYKVFMLCFCGLLILRSVIFLILDSNGSTSDDEV